MSKGGGDLSNEILQPLSERFFLIRIIRIMELKSFYLK